MYKLISWYNQNRRKFWALVFAIGIMAMISWRLIYMATDNTRTSTPTTEQTSKIDANTLNSITMQSQKSAISGQTATTTEKQISVVDKFFDYCNLGNVEEAYKLLSEECKEEMYPELKNFQEMYYNSVFRNGKRNVTVENWIGDIYRVELKEDFLSTGKYSEENSMQDYITIVKDNEGNNKLNINKYIRRVDINKTETSGNVDIKVIKKDVYMDYEIYTLEVKNNTENQIALGRVQDSDFSYLIDQNELQYRAYTNELSQPQITFTAKQTKNVQIKYFNQYSSSRRITALVFQKIVLNYDGSQSTETIRVNF